MHRSQGRSIPQPQELEIPSIEAHHDFINKVLKWSISDLERIITLLKSRAAAEDLYIQALSKIKTQSVTTPESHIYFGGAETTLLKAMTHYETTINQTIVQRKGLVGTIHAEIDKLQETKEKQEEWRKNLKNALGDKNKNYIAHRRELAKLQRAYAHKCMELQNAKLLQQQQQSQQLQQSHFPGDDDDILDIETSPSNRRSMDESRGLSTFKAQMAQVRNQFASATSQMMDNSKANVKFTKIKAEIAAADNEYREGVCTLEEYRRLQIEYTAKAHKATENMILGKTNGTKNMLRAVLAKEQAILANEMALLEISTKAVEDIDGNRDIYLFNMEYNRKQFIAPSYIHYENFYHKGKCSYLLFGQSLDDYAKEHGRTVPLLVTKCVDAVERLGGLQKEGIYRVSGRQSSISALKNAFEQNEARVDFFGENKYDIFVIASVLKIYLREFKQPLFPVTAQTRMEYATLDPQIRLTSLQKLLSSLSKPHRDTLQVVVRHLARVSSHSQTNKMNLQNLSVVFTPAIFKDHNHAEVPGEWRSDHVFEDLVMYHEHLFSTAEAQAQGFARNNNTAARATPTTGGGMLLTAPLNPSELTGNYVGPGAGDPFAHYDNHHPAVRPAMRDTPPTFVEPVKQQRSTSLTPQVMPMKIPGAMAPGRPPNFPQTQESARPPHVDSEKTELQQHVVAPPLHHTAHHAQQAGPNPLRVVVAVPTAHDNTSTTSVDSVASHSGGNGSNRMPPGQNDKTPRAGPISPLSSPTEDTASPMLGAAAPPRQDSLRMQAMLAQKANPSSTSISSSTSTPTPTATSSSSSSSMSPVKKPPPSRQHPLASSSAGPQTPTVAITANLVPSSAQVVTHPSLTTKAPDPNDHNYYDDYFNEESESSRQ